MLPNAVHIFRWDLDRTYLDTDIDSVRGLIRTAFEAASHKRNVPGSASLMRSLIRADPTARVCIVSGSPTQMRDVLAEKLALDGVRFDTLILKDNLGNLRRGRLRAVRGQIGYKLPVLLQQRVGLGPAVRETLFGDDSEADALIYAVYAAAIAREIDEKEVARILEAGHAYPDAVSQALDALRRIGKADAVEDIFIRLDRGVPVDRFRTLGKRVIPVFSWLQAAVVLWTRGRLDVDGVVDVARACTAEAGLTQQGVAGLLQDMVRRQLAGQQAVRALLDSAQALAPVADTVGIWLERLGGSPTPVSPGQEPDFFAFLHAIHKS